jgi:GNAT superfamily N-acetyltransferase
MADPIATLADGLQLRFAERADTEFVLQFIRELADYERLASEVVADEALLEKWLFGERPVAEVILAERHGDAVGFALFFHNFSTFLGRPGIYIEDIYVRPGARGTGVGKALLTCVSRIALDRGCGRLEWSVLDWNEPAIAFYERLGAVPMDEWTVYRVTGEPLIELAQSFPGSEGDHQ